MSWFESLFKRQTVQPGPSPSREEIDAQRERHGCNVCADKGERTVDNKLSSTSTKPKHSLRPQDQWSFSAPTAATTPTTTSTTTSTSVSPSSENDTPAKAANDCECLAYQNSTCPLNRRELGRASWAYLHTLAANYPENPTKAEQDRMAKFVFTYAELYPCGYCADYTRDEMLRRPPKVANRKEFQLWMCGVHNEVNYRIQKPLFNCDYVDVRWGAGPADGSCGETQL